MQKLKGTESRPEVAWSVGEGDGTKGHEETSGGDGNVKDLDCGAGLMGVYVCQNSSNCALHVKFNGCHLHLNKAVCCLFKKTNKKTDVSSDLCETLDNSLTLC